MLLLLAELDVSSSDHSISVDFFVTIHSVDGITIDGEGWVSLLDLSEFDSDWGWLVGHEVLEITDGDVFSE